MNQSRAPVHAARRLARGRLERDSVLSFWSDIAFLCSTPMTQTGGRRVERPAWSVQRFE